MESASGKNGEKTDLKELAKTTKEKDDRDDSTARRTWCVGPESECANVVADATQAVQDIIEIEEAGISENVVEIVDVPVPPRNQVQDRTVEHIAEMPSPRIQGKLVETLQREHVTSTALSSTSASVQQRNNCNRQHL